MPSPAVLPSLSVVLIRTQAAGSAEQLRSLAEIPIAGGAQFILASAEERPYLDSAEATRFGEHWVEVHEPGASPASLRRAAMRAATGDLVLFATPSTAVEKLGRLLRARSALDASDQGDGGSETD